MADPKLAKELRADFGQLVETVNNKFDWLEGSVRQARSDLQICINNLDKRITEVENS